MKFHLEARIRTEQAVAFGRALYWPAEHAEQDERPAEDAKKPGSQAL